MSLRDDGHHHCDGCGRDLDNGGVQNGVIVSDLDPDRRGHIRNLIFCRDHEEGEGRERHKVEGCAATLLDPEVIADYLANKDAVRG